MTTVRSTGRWRGIAAVALFFLAGGVLTARPAIVLVGTVGAGYAAYPRVSGPPTVELDVERRVDDGASRRGDPVTVTTRVTNVGPSTLTDCRIIDGVPPRLTVASGSPRHAAVLRPGETATFSYDIETDYGRHQFGPATVIARDVTGAHEVETTVTASTELTYTGDIPELPMQQSPDGHAGRLATDEGGSGIEFHAVREYRPGDPVGRIDSKRWARTGELTTVEFREERPTSVVVLVDARKPAYRARAEGEPNAVVHALAGAEQLIAALSETRDAVGLAALGREPCWLAPSVGPDHEERLWRTLSTSPALSAQPPQPDEQGDIERQKRMLRQQLAANSQLVVFSPLTDERIVRTVRTLSAAGYTTTVVSPDVTAEGSLGRRLAQRERTGRMRTLRGAGVPVVDWDPTTPLGTNVLEWEQRRRSV